MYAMITAGGIPSPDEQLYEMTQGKSKALLEIAGKPMIQWVLDALSGSSKVKHVIVIGLPTNPGLCCTHPLTILPGNDSIVENISAGAELLFQIDPNATQTLLISSDIPALTPQVINWMIDNITHREEDIFYSVVKRSVMEERYPNSRRSYVRLKDTQVCGGDLHAIRPQIVQRDNLLWQRIFNARKNIFKQASLVGIDILFLLLLRCLTLQEGINYINRRLGIRGTVLVSPYAEIAMDVDKPFQFEILEKELQNR